MTEAIGVPIVDAVGCKGRKAPSVGFMPGGPGADGIVGGGERGATFVFVASDDV